MCDITGDGEEDTITHAWRHPALGKLQICQSQAAIVAPGVPTNLTSSTIPDIPGVPTTLQSSFVPTIPGVPTNLTSSVSHPTLITSMAVGFLHGHMVAGGAMYSSGSTHMDGRSGTSGNEFIKVAHPTLNSGVSKVDTDYNSTSVALKTDGSLYKWGSSATLLLSGVSDVSVGGDHVLIAMTDGSLRGFGDNPNGELGALANPTANPTQILPTMGITKVSAGGGFSLILENGNLHSFGKNDKGQLGDGSLTNKANPQYITNNVSDISTSAKGDHSLILKTDGSLHTFGYNYFGQLGDGTTTDRNTPTQIVSSGVTKIATGIQHSAFLKSDGSVWVMGSNRDSALGLGSSQPDQHTPTQLVSSGATNVFAGDWFSAYTTSTGTYVAGNNTVGKLSVGASTPGGSTPLYPHTPTLML